LRWPRQGHFHACWAMVNFIGFSRRKMGNRNLGCSSPDYCSPQKNLWAQDISGLFQNYYLLCCVEMQEQSIEI
jgi:hypothetical protein